MDSDITAQPVRFLGLRAGFPPIQRVTAGFWLAAAFIIMALSADFIAPYDPQQIISPTIIHGPIWSASGSFSHLLGTDMIGRDLLSRLLHGMQHSLALGVMVTALAAGVGTALGLIAGWYGGWVAMVISRLMDVLHAIPAYLAAMAVAAGASLTYGMATLGLLTAPAFARLMRSRAEAVAQEPFVKAARGYGASPWQLMTSEILPAGFSPLIVQTTFTLSSALLWAAALGFLGLGVQPPSAELGTMIAESRTLFHSHPWQMTAPGLCLMALVFCLHRIGEELR